jgi:hypothetical protein
VRQLVDHMVHLGLKDYQYFNLDGASTLLTSSPRECCVIKPSCVVKPSCKTKGATMFVHIASQRAPATLSLEQAGRFLQTAGVNLLGTMKASCGQTTDASHPVSRHSQTTSTVQASSLSDVLQGAYDSFDT